MPADPFLLQLHLAVTLAMAGVLWVVQVAVYPLFNAMGPAPFLAYHRRYTTRIGVVVAPLMLAEAATAVALVESGLLAPTFFVSLGLLAIAWTSTAAVQVPLHQRLARGYDAPAHQRLVWTNWIRTLAWTARSALVVSLIR